MPIFIMVIGIPGSGKSTWVKKFVENLEPEVVDEWVVASSDDFIEEWASFRGMTYTQYFTPMDHEVAERAVIEMVRQAVKDGKNIIWDQININKKERAKRLKLIPENYSKYFNFFRTPEPEELKTRLCSRPDKFIPQEVIMKMIEQLEVPSLEEGFHGIIE